MARNGEILINLDLGNNGHVTLTSHDDVANWIGEQLEFWKWVTNHQNDNAIQQAWQKTSQALSRVRQANEEAVRQKETEHYKSRVDGLRASIKELSRETEVLLSSNPKAKFVHQVKQQSGAAIAAYAFSMFLGCGVTANNPNAIRGSVQAVLFDAGIKDNAKAEKESLHTVQKEFERAWSEHRAKYEELYARYNEVASVLESAVKDFSQRGAAQLEQHEKEHWNLRDNSQTEWEDIKRAFTDHMALQAPVEYWRSQRKMHKNFAVAYACASGIAALLGAIALYFLAGWLLLGEAEAWKGLPGTALLGIPVWHLVVFTIFASVVVWLLRVLTRLLLSELQLMTDAGQRVVMAKTYLSLLKEGQGPADKDRVLILQTLFRPSGAGLLKEEGQPVMPTEWLQYFTSKG